MKRRLALERAVGVGLSAVTVCSLSIVLAELGFIVAAGRSLPVWVAVAAPGLGLVAVFVDRIRRGPVSVEAAAAELDRRCGTDDLFLCAATTLDDPYYNDNPFIPSVRREAVEAIESRGVPRDASRGWPGLVRLSGPAFALAVAFLLVGGRFEGMGDNDDPRRDAAGELVLRLSGAVGGGGAELSDEARRLRELAEAIRQGRVRIESAADDLEALARSMEVDADNLDPADREALRRLIESAQADIEAIREAMLERGLSPEDLAAMPLLSEDALRQRTEEALDAARLSDLAGGGDGPADLAEIERLRRERDEAGFADVRIRFERSLNRVRQARPLTPRQEAIVRRYMETVLGESRQAE